MQTRRVSLCLAALLILTFSASAANVVDVMFRFTDFTTAGQGIKAITIEPLSKFGVDGTNIVTGDRRRFTTDASGVKIVSNILSGFNYRVTLEGAFTTTVFTNGFSTNVTGLVNAVDYIGVSTNLGGSVFAYSQAEADALFQPLDSDLTQWAGVGTNSYANIPQLNTTSNALAAQIAAIEIIGGSATNVNFLASPTVEPSIVGGSNVFTVIDSPSLGGVPAIGYGLVGQTLPPTVTPWATAGPLDSNSQPWVVYSTLVATNAGVNSQFPSLAYDAMRGALVGLYTKSTNHLGADGEIHIVRSVDGSRTWTDEVLTLSFPVVTTGITALRDGSLLATFLERGWNSGSVLFGNFTYHPFQFYRSVDGSTWSAYSTFPNNNTNHFGNDGVMETAHGTWLQTFYSGQTGTNGSLGRSTDRGASWVIHGVDINCNEGLIRTHPVTGELFYFGRTPATTHRVSVSTNDGVSWQYVGLSGTTNLFAAFPAWTFMGNRALMLGRMQPFGDSCMWYSDSYPYTNGWTQLTLHEYPSLQGGLVNLSPSVVCALVSYDRDLGLGSAGSPKTNSWVEAHVISNNGEGWSQLKATTNRPVIDLRAGGISPVGDYLTRWSNYGLLGFSPTNGATFQGPISTGNGMAFFWNRTNSVTFGVSNVLQSFWQTNYGTVIWKAARTNAADNAWILENKNATTGNGFSLKHFGGNIYFTQGNGSAASGNYTLIGSADITGTPHVYALRFHAEKAEVFVDGVRSTYLPTANAGNATYSTAAQSFLPLSVGAFGSSASGTNIFLGAIKAFTNALSDAEIYAEMVLMKDQPHSLSAAYLATSAAIDGANITSGTVNSNAFDAGTIDWINAGGGSGDVTLAGNNAFTGSNNFAGVTVFGGSVTIPDGSVDNLSVGSLQLNFASTVPVLNASSNLVAAPVIVRPSDSTNAFTPYLLLVTTINGTNMFLPLVSTNGL